MSEYQEKIAQAYLKHLKKVESILELRGKKILDFGCGKGAGTVAWSLQGLDIVGVDNNQPGWDYISEATTYAREKNSHAQFYMQDGEQLEFGDETFDVVLNVDVLEHLKNPFAVFKEMKRVLKSGGVIVTFWQPYYAPYGGHIRYYSKNPWRQLMPFYDNERYMKKAVVRNPIMPYENIMAVLNSLNKLTLRGFRKLLKDLDVQTVEFRRMPFDLDYSVTGIAAERYIRKMINSLPLLPLIEEFTTQSVLVVVKKRP
jgi:ubiquinone/menaquinone biosynthesis C-methylase UbiE